MKIGKRELRIPIIQGGMGVGISLSGLAGAVAACGGMGVISAAHPGYREPDFYENPLAVNCRALKEEIQKAKARVREGLVGVNIMVAMEHYADYVRAAIAAGADAIISGAGLPTELPALAQGADILLAPIVSSARAVKVICRAWERKAGRYPDFVVVEGPLAGGHLGFSAEEAEGGTAASLETIVPEVIAELRPYEEKAGRPIPVLPAGGIFDGADIARMEKLGAAGAQIATRFIATEECDAAPGYKQAMVDAAEEDVRIVRSPVGMPGRALRSPLIERVAAAGRLAPRRCLRCIRTCDPATTPYCITDALIAAAKGDWENGLFFCGANVGRVKGITTVAALMQELVTDWRNNR